MQELQREVQKLGAALQEAEGLGQELRQSLEGVQENLQALQEQHCQLKETESAVSLQVMCLPTLHPRWRICRQQS